MRKETDALGEMLLPDEVYYGIQTERNCQCLAITDDPLASLSGLHQGRRP